MNDSKMIHFVVSSKGGTGKTILTFSLLRKFVRGEKNILLIDSNVKNPDTYEILNRFGGQKETGILESPPDRKYNKIKTSHGNEITVIAPANSHRLFEGIQEFYSFVDVSIQEFSPDFVLIDTGFHVGNLKSYEDSYSIPTTLRERVPYFWFIWTLRNIESVSEIELVDEASTWIENNWGTYKPKDNLIHVINPNALFPISSLMDSMNIARLVGIFMGRDRPLQVFLEEIRKFNDCNLANGLNMKELRFILIDFAKSKLARDKHSILVPDIEISKIPHKTVRPEEMLQEFIKFLHIRCKGRPSNFFAIESYDHRLVNWSDKMLHYADIYTSLNKLLEECEPIGTFVEEYLRKLNRYKQIPER